MEDRILKLITALRSAGVRISLAESADSFLAVESLGIKNRHVFKTSLQATLIKDARNLAIFEELFDMFFGSSENPPLANLSDDLTPGEAHMLAQALRQFNDRIRDMLERLVNGEQLSQEELDHLAKFTGLTQTQNLRYRDWIAKRMQKALKFQEVREALDELAKTLQEMGMDKQRVEQLQQMLDANLQNLEEQIQQYTGQKIAENMSKTDSGEPIDNLLNRPFSALSDKDMERLRKEVRRLATILRTKVALRQKRAKSGQLDAKATIRANLKHGNVPIQIKHKARTLKPKLVLLCDISTSMRFCSELMLSLLHALQDQIKKTNSFAFISHLEYITPFLEGREAGEAVGLVLERMPAGYYNTDLGYSLENFAQNYLDTVDSRTTLLVVGDGRNNYNDPRMDVFRMLARRSQRTIWINPEVPALWGTGDSDMHKYAVECDTILQARNLSELINAVDKLLANA